MSSASSNDENGTRDHLEPWSPQDTDAHQRGPEPSSRRGSRNEATWPGRSARAYHPPPPGAWTPPDAPLREANVPPGDWPSPWMSAESFGPPHAPWGHPVSPLAASSPAWPRYERHEDGWDPRSGATPHEDPRRDMSGPHVGRGPRGYRRADARIEEEINDLLWHHGRIDASDVEVHVEDGVVTLEGTVADRRQKRLAEDLADTVGGVDHVVNHLRAADRQRRGGADEG